MKLQLAQKMDKLRAHLSDKRTALWINLGWA